MAKLRREQEKVNCQFCDKEVAKSGLANHERNCPMNPENVDKDVTELEDVEEDIEEEDVEDEALESDESDEEESEEEEETEAVSAVADNGDMVVAIGLHSHKFFQYTDYIVIEKGVEITLSKENFKVLAQQGHVALK